MLILGLTVLVLVMTLLWHASKALFSLPEGSKPKPAKTKPKALTPKQLADKARRVARKEAAIFEALSMMDQPFVVADIETTGLCRRDHDIIEMAAVLVNQCGQVMAEFSTLVQTGGRVPWEITELTGITTKDLKTTGKPLGAALTSFLGFIGDYPVFFHNASFDKGFIQEAVRRTQPKETAQLGGYKFEEGIFDSLPIARHAWPNLPNHKLSSLAGMVKAPAATHRALADVKALVSVLVAAKVQIQASRRFTEPRTA